MNLEKTHEVKHLSVVIATNPSLLEHFLLGENLGRPDSRTRTIAAITDFALELIETADKKRIHKDKTHVEEATEAEVSAEG